MIRESYPWKKGLLFWKGILLRNNTAERFEQNTEAAYIAVEKSIFYSAFIVRKLLDCYGKMSDEAERYVVPLNVIKASSHIDILHRWPEENSHEWEHVKSETRNGRNICDWLIHSYIFFLELEVDGIVTSFHVASDYDRNKKIYKVELKEWIAYIDYIAADDIVGLFSRFDKEKKKLVYLRKERFQK